MSSSQAYDKPFFIQTGMTGTQSLFMWFDGERRLDTGVIETREMSREEATEQ